MDQYGHGEISDLKPLAGLTALDELYLPGQRNIGRIAPCGVNRAKAPKSCKQQNLGYIPLAGLTNLEWLSVARNEISDFSPLDGFRENLKLEWYGNPGYSQPRGTKDRGTVAMGRVTEYKTETLSDRIYYQR